MVPGQAIGWTEFDVLAEDAAGGARVAMWLREALPAAFLRSEPDPSFSGDPARPHCLHCSARVGELTGEDAVEHLRALAGLEILAGKAPRAVVVFAAASESQPRAA